MDNTAPVPAPGGLLARQALPVPSQPAVSAKPAPPPKHFLAAFFLSFFLGVFGADRFYLGMYWTGALKLLTFGLFGIGAIVDLALIMNGAMRDKKGNALAGYEQYRGTARRTVVWITVAVAVFVLVNAVALILAFQALMTQLNGSDFSRYLGGGADGGQSVDPNSLLSL